MVVSLNRESRAHALAAHPFLPSRGYYWLLLETKTGSTIPPSVWALEHGFFKNQIYDLVINVDDACYSDGDAVLRGPGDPVLRGPPVR